MFKLSTKSGRLSFNICLCLFSIYDYRK
jgi:hypothetical protein